MAKKKRAIARPYRVFISHATADKWIAATIYEKLEAMGASPFLDSHDIEGGDDIPDSIRAAIKSSQEFLVLLTPNSVNRPWVTLEVGVAWGWSMKMRITVVMCHVDTDPIPGMIRSKKAIDINDLPEFFTQVSARVRKHNGDA